MGYPGYLPLSLLTEFEAANCFHLLLRCGNWKHDRLGNMTTRIATSLIMLVLLSVCCQDSRAKVIGDFDHLMRAIDNDVNHQEVRECGKLLEGHLGHLEVTRSNMDGLHSPHMSHASPLLVWGVTMTAVTLIVVCDVMAILVVPVLQKMFLNQVNQFLIAMSVGSLTGDAFLHLVPHAMAANSHHGEMEQGCCLS